MCFFGEQGPKMDMLALWLVYQATQYTQSKATQVMQLNVEAMHWLIRPLQDMESTEMMPMIYQVGIIQTAIIGDHAGTVITAPLKLSIALGWAADCMCVELVDTARQEFLELAE